MDAGKVIGAIITAILAIIGFFFGWLIRGNKENKKHKKTQRIIIKLEKRLRAVEEELGSSKNVAMSHIKKLAEERGNLVAKLNELKATHELKAA